jgi:hypothetical protein
MNYELLGGVKVFRPSIKTELAVRYEVEQAMRGKHATGTYTDGGIINGILQDYFGIYDAMIKSELPKIASRHLMEFILYQYDQSCQVAKAHLDNQETDRWNKLGPMFRRAAKYLAECTAMLTPVEEPEVNKYKIEQITEQCWICAEQLVSISILSTQTFILFPEYTTLEIRPEGELEWFILTVKDAKRYEQFQKRVAIDRESRKRVIDEQKTLYDSNRLVRVIDPIFQDQLGINLTDVLSFAFNLAVNVKPPDKGFDVPFVPEQQITDSLVQGSSLTPQQAKVIIDGLGLRQTAMVAEGRVVWKPKQEYRAYSRPFFEFPHPTGTHFTWSKQMANECLLMLYTHLAQKLVPKEWNIGDIPKALAAYEQEITKLFEDIVIERLKEAGLSASRFKSQIGLGANKIDIPDDIGEIDLVAYWEAEKLLVVGDDKLVKPTHEPALFRDDLDKFIGKKKNYVEQVKRKTRWVVDNIQGVVKGLEASPEFPQPLTVEKVAPILVTYYPAFASYFVSDVPCVTLTELIADINGKKKWPYTPTHQV